MKIRPWKLEMKMWGKPTVLRRLDMTVNIRECVEGLLWAFGVQVKASFKCLNDLTHCT